MATVSLKQFYNAALDVSDLLAEERYANWELISKGATKVVYEVTDKHCSREVAYAKIRKGVFSLENALDFVREVQVTSGFEHPNIIRIYDVGIEEGAPWFTMELGSGKTLTHLVEEEPGLLLSERLEIFVQLCDAVDYAHERDVLHLDLKPNNVSIGKRGQILLADWGLAAGAHREPEGDLVNAHAQQGKIKGSLGYMAPDQTDAELWNTASSDVFGLGAILYFLLTKEAPIPGNKKEEILTNTKAGKIKSLHREEIPPRLVPLLKKVLTKDPKNRYHSVASLKEEIEAFRGGFSTLAERPSLGREIHLLIRRNKGFCFTVAIALMSLIAVSVFYVKSIKKSERTAKNAQIEALAQKQMAEDTLEKFMASEQRMKETNEDFSEILFDDSFDQLSKFNFKAAMTSAQDAVTRNPENTSCQHRLGAIYLIHQDFEKAATHLVKSHAHVRIRLLKICEKYRKKPQPLSVEDQMLLLDDLSECPFLKICTFQFLVTRKSRVDSALFSHMLADLNKIDAISFNYSFKLRTLNLTGNSKLKTVIYPETRGSKSLNLLQSLRLRKLVLDDNEYNRTHAKMFQPSEKCEVIFK